MHDQTAEPLASSDGERIVPLSGVQVHTSQYRRVQRSAWVRYGAAVLITAAALGLKLLLVPLISADVPFLFFFAAVMASAVTGGMGPGLLATGLAAICDSYFFTAPFG